MRKWKGFAKKSLKIFGVVEYFIFRKTLSEKYPECDRGRCQSQLENVFFFSMNMWSYELDDFI